jgi:hypothetical protein
MPSWRNSATSGDNAFYTEKSPTRATTSVLSFGSRGTTAYRATPEAQPWLEEQG